MVERVVYVGSTTQVHVRLPGGEAAAVADGQHRRRPGLAGGHARRASTLPADALRALPGVMAPADAAPRVVRRARRAGRRAGRADPAATSVPKRRSAGRRRRRDVAALAAITADGVGFDAALRSSTTCCCRTTSPSTTAASSPTSRPRRRRRRRCSTPSSGRGRSPARAGRRPAPRWPPRTPPSTGCAALAGLPDGPAGASCPAGRPATSAALAVARDAWRRAHPRRGPAGRWPCAPSAHSSVRGAGRAARPRRRRGRRRRPRPAHRRALRRARRPAMCAVVASAGATNTGAVDDLAGVADVCAGARRVAPRRRRVRRRRAVPCPSWPARFAGIERADSLVIDPHKWLFAPARLRRRALPGPGARPRAPTASRPAYLDAFGDEHVNPSDLAFHLTRRARGLPLWFALVVHGTDAYASAVRAGVELARAAADLVRRARPAAAAGDGAGAVGRRCSSATAGRRADWDGGRPTPSPTAWPSSRRPPGTAGPAAASRSSTRAPRSPPSSELLGAAVA